MDMFYIGLVFVAGILFGQCLLGRRQKKQLQEVQCLAEKHLEMFLLMDRWLWSKQHQKKIGEYLWREGYRNITIYGVGYIGKRLYDELIREEVNVIQLVDRKGGMKYSGMKVKQLLEEMEPSEVVIVTSIYYFEELEEELLQKFGCKVLSLWDIVYKM